MNTALSTDCLRCFVEGARHLNFRAASHAVALSPAAFGQRIRQLEDDLDERLFERTTRSVMLTEAGARLLPYARRVLEDIDDCARAARGDLAAPDIELLLGTRHELGLSWIVPALPRVARDLPQLTVHLYFGSGPDIGGGIAARQLDCGIMSTRLRDPKLDWAPLHEERYVLVASPKLVKRQPLRSEDDAKSHTLIDIDRQLPLFRYWRDAVGGWDSTAFQSIRRMGTIAAIRVLVLRGEGVAVLPEYFVRGDLKNKRLVRQVPRVSANTDTFRLVFRGDDPRRPTFDALAKVLRTCPVK